MVISLTVPAKSFACSIAMSRFTRVSQTIMLPNAATIISQIAPVRRSQMGVSENRIILILAVLRTVGGVRTGTLYPFLTAADAPA